MSKDLRVTLRITEALDIWLGVEGDKRGLDKAAFARMLLFERMNGPQTTAQPSVRPMEVPPWEEVYPDSELNGTVNPNRMPPGATEKPQDALDTPNVDDMVQTALDDAKAIPEPPQAEIEVRGSGVRPVRRPPVPYSKGIPAWIPQ